LLDRCGSVRFDARIGDIQHKTPRIGQVIWKNKQKFKGFYKKILQIKSLFLIRWSEWENIFANPKLLVFQIKRKANEFLKLNSVWKFYLFNFFLKILQTKEWERSVQKQDLLSHYHRTRFQRCLMKRCCLSESYVL
jgi:hypothetical protein